MKDNEIGEIKGNSSLKKLKKMYCLLAGRGGFNEVKGNSGEWLDVNLVNPG